MLKVSTRFRYGLRAMIELAEAYPEQAVSVGQIAQRQELSPKYLEQIMAQLKAAGLVLSHPGMRGGYRLSRHPDSIRITDIAYALEGDISVTDCAKNPENCKRAGICKSQNLWVRITSAIENVLSSTTLRGLMDGKDG